MALLPFKPRVDRPIARIDRKTQTVTAGQSNPFEIVPASVDGGGSEKHDYTFYVRLDSLGEIRMTSENLLAYSEDYMKGRSTSASANTTASQAYIKVCECDNITYPSLAEVKITGYIGNKRHISVFHTYHDGATVVQKTSYYTADTSTEIDSFQFYSPVNDTLTYSIVGTAVPKLQYNPHAILLSHKVLSAQTADIIYGGVNDTEGVDDLDGDLYDYYVMSSGLDGGTISGYVNENTSSKIRQYMSNSNGAIFSGNDTKTRDFLLTNQSEVFINYETGRKGIFPATFNQLVTNQQHETCYWNPDTSTKMSSLLLRPSASVNCDIWFYAVPKGYNADLTPWKFRQPHLVSNASFAGGKSFEIPSRAMFARIQAIGESAIGSNIEIDFNTTTSVSKQYLKSSSSSTTALFATNRTIGKIDLVSNIDCIVALKGGANRPMLSKSQYNENTIDLNALWALDSSTVYTDLILKADNTNAMTTEFVVSFI
jgi:hypothetical protein